MIPQPVLPWLVNHQCRICGEIIWGLWRRRAIDRAAPAYNRKRYQAHRNNLHQAQILLDTAPRI